MHNVKTTLTQAKANGELFNDHSFRTGTATLDAERCPRIQDKDFGSLAELGPPKLHPPI